MLTLGNGFEEGLIDSGLCRLLGNELRGRSAVFQRQIEGALQAAAQGAVQSIELPKRRIRLTFVPLVDEEGLNLPAPTIALFMESLEKQLDSPTQVAAKRFGYTAAETDVCELLIAGCSVQGIAEQRSVSIWTVRTQLKSIFRKSDVRNQSALVAKISTVSDS